MSLTTTQPPAIQATFRNAIAEGADPWVVYHQGHYYWTFAAAGRGVYVFRSDRLTSLGERHLAWQAPASGPYSREVWAPELHHIDGQWYIYTTASDGNNATHRVIVLESTTGEPLGPYRFKAQLYTGDNHTTGAINRWAIDATPLELRGRRYLVWSGWEADADEQWLYIAPLANPWTTAGNRVRLCSNDDYLWERVGGTRAGRGLNEAPQILQRDGRTFIVFSACGSWEPIYKLGLLELVGDDPLSPASWRKFPEPVFCATDETWGAGHACFTRSPDGTEDWMVYHAKETRERDWKRSVFVQPFRFVNGLPDFGRPVARGAALFVPSGQRTLARSRHDYVSDFARGWGEWDYYGHQDLISVQNGRLYLGDFNDHLAMFRSGEKLLLRDHGWGEFTVTASLELDDAGARLGVLLGAGAPNLGFDQQEGLFVGIEVGAVVVYRWHAGIRSELLRQPADVRAQVGYQLVLKVTCHGIEMLAPWQFSLTDAQARAVEGMIGILLERGRGVVEKLAVSSLA